MGTAPEPTSAIHTVPPVPARPLRAALLGFFVDLAIAIGLGFALMMIGGLIWGVLAAIRMAMKGAGEAEITAAITMPGAIAQIVIVLFGMGGVALLLYFWRRPATMQERQRSLAAAKRIGTWLAVAAVALLTYASGALATWGGERLGTPPHPSNLALIREASSGYPIFLGLFAVALAPLYEELLFRRVLFGRLWQAGYPGLGMLLSAAAFALAHELPGVSGNGAAATALLLGAYGVMGIAFAWLYRHTGTLWAAIAAHALNNALALMAMKFAGA